MPQRPNKLTRTHRAIMAPLLRELQRRLEFQNYVDIATKTDVPNWKVSRILSENVVSPSYVDVTRLAVAAGLSPNDAAKIAGLYQEKSRRNTMLNEDVAAFAATFDIALLPRRSRERLLQQFQVLLESEKYFQELHKEDTEAKNDDGQALNG